MNWYCVQQVIYYATFSYIQDMQAGEFGHQEVASIHQLTASALMHAALECL